MIKSPQYRKFVQSQPSCVGMSRHSQAHHEVIFTRASNKRWNDYNCVPLSEEMHTLRHQIGFDQFWSKYNKNPKEIALNLLIKYRDTIFPSEFDSLADYDDELDRVEDHIRILQEIELP